ncbi:GRIP [Acanthosepion pharaonis]|uniref:GRIP n=1 Tax=Acanthosepion pharaonis TaxID=158019 RepID=A0A812CJX1_ACAPH|nr:GRIP [Sepia pharaonis]
MAGNCDCKTVHYHPAPDIGAPDLRQETDEDRKGTTVVELRKIEGCTLGLTISGGVDKNCRPQVSNLRPGSIAHRCDALEVGDFILSVNGIRTSGLRHEEIVNLLKNAGEHVILEVEYEVPESDAVQNATGPLLVEIEKIPGVSLGIGLAHSVRNGKRSICIESVAPMGIADR